MQRTSSTQLTAEYVASMILNLFDASRLQKCVSSWDDLTKIILFLTDKQKLSLLKILGDERLKHIAKSLSITHGYSHEAFSTFNTLIALKNLGCVDIFLSDSFFSMRIDSDLDCAYKFLASLDLITLSRLIKDKNSFVNFLSFISIEKRIDILNRFPDGYFAYIVKSFSDLLEIVQCFPCSGQYQVVLSKVSCYDAKHQYKLCEDIFYCKRIYDYRKKQLPLDDEKSITTDFKCSMVTSVYTRYIILPKVKLLDSTPDFGAIADIPLSKLYCQLRGFFRTFEVANYVMGIEYPDDYLVKFDLRLDQFQRSADERISFRVDSIQWCGSYPLSYQSVVMNSHYDFKVSTNIPAMIKWLETKVQKLKNENFHRHEKIAFYEQELINCNDKVKRQLLMSGFHGPIMLEVEKYQIYLLNCIEQEWPQENFYKGLFQFFKILLFYRFKYQLPKESKYEIYWRDLYNLLEKVVKEDKACSNSFKDRFRQYATVAEINNILNGKQIDIGQLVRNLKAYLTAYLFTYFNNKADVKNHSINPASVLKDLKDTPSTILKSGGKFSLWKSTGEKFVSYIEMKLGEMEKLTPQAGQLQGSSVGLSADVKRAL